MALLIPLLFVPWVGFCACHWFHPEHGNMQPSSAIIGKLPPLLQSAIRWYAAIFIGFSVFVAGIVAPVMAILSHFFP